MISVHSLFCTNKRSQTPLTSVHLIVLILIIRLRCQQYTSFFCMEVKFTIAGACTRLCSKPSVENAPEKIKFKPFSHLRLYEKTWFDLMSYLRVIWIGTNASKGLLRSSNYNYKSCMKLKYGYVMYRCSFDSRNQLKIAF